MAQRQRVGFQTRRLGVRIPLASFCYKCAFLAQMVERWPFKPMVVGSIPTEGVTLLVGVVGNISACHADARGSIPRRGALVPVSLVGQDIRLSSGRPGFKSRTGNLLEARDRNPDVPRCGTTVMGD